MKAHQEACSGALKVGPWERARRFSLRGRFREDEEIWTLEVAGLPKVSAFVAALIEPRTLIEALPPDRTLPPQGSCKDYLDRCWKFDRGQRGWPDTAEPPDRWKWDLAQVCAFVS
jgi:hypothetical protein